MKRYYAIPITQYRRTAVRSLTYTELFLTTKQQASSSLKCYAYNNTIYIALLVKQWLIFLSPYWEGGREGGREGGKELYR